jgi:CheY-like chemotaxis protein
VPREGAGQRILIVDDEAAVRYALRRYLPLGEFSIEEATRGIEGLRAARATQPSAIFLDLNMPDLTGDVVLDELRADPATSGIPVVIFTSATLDETRQRALRRHAVALLPKAALGDDAAAERVRDALREATLAVGR